MKKLIRKNFFCYICRQFAEHVFNDYLGLWECCHCNPLMLEDSNITKPESIESEEN